MRTFDEKLKKYGWISLSDSSLMNMKKEDLVQVIRNLEYNYVCASERLNNQKDYLDNKTQNNYSNDSSLDPSVETWIF